MVCVRYSVGDPVLAGHNLGMLFRVIPTTERMYCVCGTMYTPWTHIPGKSTSPPVVVLKRFP